MEHWPRAFGQNDAQFKELFGVKKEIFREMHSVLTLAAEQRRRKGGRHPKLSVGDPLFLTLQYWREYRTMAHLAFDFGVAKSTVSDTIVLVENTLIQDGSFHLPGKKALLMKENTGRTLAVDVTESPVERPEKNRKSGIPARKNDTRSRRKSQPTLRLWKFSARPNARGRFTIFNCSKRRCMRFLLEFCCRPTVVIKGC